MRKYLFRAKRNDNGEWVEAKSVADCTFEDGDVRWYAGAGQPGAFALDEYGNILEAATKGECLFYEVDPETIGQYTELTDKNGKKVFEGDVLLVYGTDTAVVEWDETTAMFMAVFGYTDADFASLISQYPDVEVIGNIHDNPELRMNDNDST